MHAAGVLPAVLFQDEIQSTSTDSLARRMGGALVCRVAERWALWGTKW